MKFPKSKRARRVGVEIQKIVADELRDIVLLHFPGVMVSVPEVRVSDDLGVAAVYVSVLSVEDRDPVHREIAKHAKQVRSKAAAALRMRKLPEFRFVWDDTMERADRIEQLLTQLNDSSPPRTEGPRGVE